MEWVSGNIYIRPIPLAKAGDSGGGEHTHNFDHTSIIFRGSVRVTGTLPDGRVMTVERKAPAYLLIKANVKHQIVALEENTEVWCVYSHRTPQGDVVQVWTGWQEAVL